MGQSGLNPPQEDWVVIGRVGTAFGVKGWVHVHSFAETPENIRSYASWHLKHATGEVVSVEVSHIQAHGSHFVAKLKGCDDRDVALTWTHAEIRVPRTELPVLPEGEYYWADLLGLTVINTHGQRLGVVYDFFETGSNDVFVVKEGPKEYLIPYVPDEYVISVDLETKMLVVNWEEDY